MGTATKTVAGNSWKKCDKTTFVAFRFYESHLLGMSGYATDASNSMICLLTLSDKTMAMGLLILQTGFICSANEQSPHSGIVPLPLAGNEGAFWIFAHGSTLTLLQHWLTQVHLDKSHLLQMNTAMLCTTANTLHRWTLSIDELLMVDVPQWKSMAKFSV